MAVQSDALIGRKAVRLRTFAEMLDVSEGLARQWMREGKIKTFRMGKFIMVSCAEADRLIAEHSRGPVAA